MKTKQQPLSIEQCSNIETQIKTLSLYEYFLKKIYTINTTSSSEKNISIQQKFFSSINNSSPALLQDTDFWWKYFLFQFIYWSKLELLNEKSVSYSFVVGTKAWERWINRDHNYDFTILSNKVKSQHSISYIDYKNYLIISNRTKNPNAAHTVLRPSLSESLVRRRFHNTDRGFNLCLTTTSLYDPRDKSCILCTQKHTCKIILQNNNSRLFNIRLIK